jgi:hypothetical protein
MRVRMRKMTAPTTRLPATTNSPKLLITSPASACRRMSRVEETLRPSRKSVVMSRMLGSAAMRSASET